jgi:hypothetical protein
MTQLSIAVLWQSRLMAKEAAERVIPEVDQERPSHTLTYGPVITLVSYHQ